MADVEHSFRKGFLESAGIGHFSLCFNDAEKPDAGGVLRLGTEPMPNALPSAGKAHWALGFEGISVGDAAADVVFCSPSNMPAGQETPCGAIPDSGSTAFMAPKE